MSWLEQATIETAAEKAAEAKETARQQAKRVRDEALASLTFTFDDGSVMQNRPQDAANIQTAIALGVSRDWLMNDNTKRLTTVAELQAALNAGVTQAAQIWQTYIDEVTAL